MTSTRRRPLATAATLVAAAAAFAVVLPALGAAPAGASACTDSSGRAGVAVRVVVDDGTTATATDLCVPDGATGQAALVERARRLGLPPPRTDARFVAFLCAIDGLPDRGCAVDNSSDRYWAYWTASAGSDEWNYAPIGMADRRLRAGDVDGWRLLPLGGRKLPPRRCPDGDPCPEATPPPAPTTTGSPSPTAVASPSAAPPIAPAPVVTVAPSRRPAASPTTRPSTATPTPGGMTGAPVAPSPATDDPGATTSTVVEVAGRVEERAATDEAGPDAGPTTTAARTDTATVGAEEDAATSGGAWAALAVVAAAGLLALVQSRRTRLRR